MAPDRQVGDEAAVQILTHCVPNLSRQQIMQRPSRQMSDAGERAGSLQAAARDKGKVEQRAIRPACAHFIGGIAVLLDDRGGIKHLASNRPCLSLLKFLASGLS